MHAYTIAYTIAHNATHACMHVAYILNVCGSQYYNIYMHACTQWHACNAHKATHACMHV